MLHFLQWTERRRKICLQNQPALI